MSERNPDLPILDELGAEFASLVSAAYAAEASPRAEVDRPVDGPDRHTVRRRAPLPPSRPIRERGAQARRIGRRAAIMLVLICLVGGVAFAALNRSGGGSSPSHTPPTALGRAGDGAWSFSAYRDGGRLCTVFLPRGGELSGSCGATPGRGRLRAGSAIADGRRYVFGVAGPGVGRVTVTIGEGSSPAGRTGREARGAVLAPQDRGAATTAGFPVGDGWFVIDLGGVGGVARESPAIVTPLTRGDRRAGPAYVDCSLGVVGPACRRRIEAAAAGN